MSEHEPLDISQAISRASVRTTLRQRRRAVRGAARARAAEAVAARVAAGHWLRPGLRVGLYLPLPEELDCGPLLHVAAARGCDVYLPRGTSYRHFRMAFFDGSRPLVRSRYGILEPQGTVPFPVRRLDILFMPLVGFDHLGNRMGMGKGFYDRLLNYRRFREHWRAPRLIGLAYDRQQVTLLPVQSHDVPLDAVVTESTVHRFRRDGRP
jgi:5-formyltetrahydrofolate cyclo-ligase